MCCCSSKRKRRVMLWVYKGKGLICRRFLEDSGKWQHLIGTLMTKSKLDCSLQLSLPSRWAPLALVSASIFLAGTSTMLLPDQEQFTRQLLYYLGGFAGGIPFFVLRDYARETLALRWRSWMTSYYIERYLKNQTFYKIQSQSIIDNPDQRIVDDLSSFTGTALSFSLALFNAAVDLISFSNILYGIYPPLFVVLLVYSLGGTAITVFLGRGLVTLNFLQEKKEADFRYGLVRVRENAESIAFYAGEESEMYLLLQRFRSAFENLTQLLISSRNLEFFTDGYRYLIQILPAAVFQAISAFSAVIDRLGEFDDILDNSSSTSLSDPLEEIHVAYKNFKYSPVLESNVSTPLENCGPLLEIDSLTLKTPSQAILVRDLSLVINDKDHLLVTGSSGSGKTSLLRAMADSNKPNGLLPFLMRAPKAERGNEKPREPTTDELMKVLVDVHLDYILSRFSGLDSTHEWSSVLSLGEQQRLAFARLLLSKPELVLLDESTSALDEANEAHLYQQIAAAGITYISVGPSRNPI
ncbi:ABC transporter D family protein [Quillaja saponaria]|uniref:ABC transporter D family protein n=2 Tax=Quillaja saponaria TaxID=32244 RepID=A0AAD7QIJ0_QUISA|nr:ABC transporter D family protein [Quillaja saponaria]